MLCTWLERICRIFVELFDLFRKLFSNFCNIMSFVTFTVIIIDKMKGGVLWQGSDTVMFEKLSLKNGRKNRDFFQGPGDVFCKKWKERQKSRETVSLSTNTWICIGVRNTYICMCGFWMLYCQERWFRVYYTLFAHYGPSILHINVRSSWCLMRRDSTEPLTAPRYVYMYTLHFYFDAEFKKFKLKIWKKTKVIFELWPRIVSWRFVISFWSFLSKEAFCETRFLRSCLSLDGCKSWTLQYMDIVPEDFLWTQHMHSTPCLPGLTCLT